MVPFDELASRWARCRAALSRLVPDAGGALVFSRLNIYYFTGTFASGVFWLPLEGEPVLFCRRGIERARIESSLKEIQPFNSYRDVETILSDMGSPLPRVLGAEMSGLSWTLATSLTRHLAGHGFVSADTVLRLVRARKSAWELAFIREAGSRHARCLTELLPPLLREGMSELDISHRIWELFLAEGHMGVLRMENFGEEAFLGHIAVGESANYPSVFNGPVGLRGVHPAAPCMGSAEVKWTEGSPLTVDNGFTLAGYITDKTQVYWLGTQETIPPGALRAHAFCVELQERIAGLLKPGIAAREIWEDCSRRVDGSEWREGFMGLGKNKVSFVGHGIGLAIDEFPVLAGGCDVPLEEGMTLAIEPKIGISGFGMVGVENTFEVTSEGGRCLTGNTFDIISV